MHLTQVFHPIGLESKIIRPFSSCASFNMIWCFMMDVVVPSKWLEMLT
uniref:Uncharacterized protein n=1 Tax=Rhizophora mucronata TaxID=61149 RepID=A0A2P2P041_RHIMU